MLVPEPLGKAADYHSVGEKVSISTWNVWFDKRERDVRNRALLEELGRIRPDICCFQEVTPPFVRALQACPWMEDDYWISGTHHQDIGTQRNRWLGNQPSTKHERQHRQHQNDRRELYVSLKMRHGAPSDPESRRLMRLRRRKTLLH